MIRRAFVTAVLIVATGAAAAPQALADGDPASDYLVDQQVFLTAQSTPTTPAQRELVRQVAAANRAGYALRVALVPTKYDLGSITVLWHKPRLYARFLGLELSGLYKGRLLVVMPDGFGFNWPHHSVSASYRLLASERFAAGDTTLASSARAVVRRLTQAAGIKLAVSAAAKPAAGHASGASDDTALFVVIGVLAVLALGAGAWFGLRRVNLDAIPLRWMVAGSAAVVILAVGIPIVLATRRSTSTAVPAADVPTPPPFQWRAGQRIAPNFVLRDQGGKPVSIARFRGRPVILTFTDPLCRNLCPLEAHLLNQVVSQMPPSRRPAIVAVSVDPAADARANLLLDERKWSLVPQWHWAVGPHAELAAIWKRYSIGVSVTTRRIAGTTIKYIIHTEASYIIDATGHERALFLWPFYSPDVERTLRRLS